LRESFDQAKPNLLLSAAVAAPAPIANKAYDVNPFNKYLDYVQIMNYDFHMYSKLEPCTGFNAPLFSKQYEFGILSKMNSDYSTQHWLERGLWANKTIFGIPTYGRGYTLLNKYFHFLYAPAVGHANIGAAYPFVCNLTKTKNYKYVFDEKTRSAYIHGGDRQWLGLENPITMFTKASYIKTYNLAGIMIYDLASDDYKVLLVTPCLCSDEWHHKIRSIIGRCPVIFDIQLMVLVEKLDVFYKNYVKSWETSGDDLKLGSSSKEAETWPTRI
uniref:Glyco_18 domain-containing protein n=1 Tax=Brugia timori TaxID=42155 RepID=A0A0R3Q5R0_9BILA